MDGNKTDSYYNTRNKIRHLSTDNNFNFNSSPDKSKYQAQTNYNFGSFSGARRTQFEDLQLKTAPDEIISHKLNLNNINYKNTSNFYKNHINNLKYNKTSESRYNDHDDSTSFANNFLDEEKIGGVINKIKTEVDGLSRQIRVSEDNIETLKVITSSPEVKKKQSAPTFYTADGIRNYSKINHKPKISTPSVGNTILNSLMNKNKVLEFELSKIKGKFEELNSTPGINRKSVSKFEIEKKIEQFDPYESRTRFVSEPNIIFTQEIEADNNKEIKDLKEINAARQKEIINLRNILSKYIPNDLKEENYQITHSYTTPYGAQFYLIKHKITSKINFITKEDLLKYKFDFSKITNVVSLDMLQIQYETIRKEFEKRELNMINDLKLERERFNEVKDEFEKITGKSKQMIESASKFKSQNKEIAAQNKEIKLELEAKGNLLATCELKFRDINEKLEFYIKEYNKIKVTNELLIEENNNKRSDIIIADLKEKLKVLEDKYTNQFDFSNKTINELNEKLKNKISEFENLAKENETIQTKNNQLIMLNEENKELLIKISEEINAYKSEIENLKEKCKKSEVSYHTEKKKSKAQFDEISSLHNQIQNIPNVINDEIRKYKLGINQNIQESVDNKIKKLKDKLETSLCEKNQIENQIIFLTEENNKLNEKNRELLRDLITYDSNFKELENKNKNLEEKTKEAQLMTEMLNKQINRINETKLEEEVAKSELIKSKFLMEDIIKDMKNENKRLRSIQLVQMEEMNRKFTDTFSRRVECIQILALPEFTKYRHVTDDEINATNTLLNSLKQTVENSKNDSDNIKSKYDEVKNNLEESLFKLSSVESELRLKSEELENLRNKYKNSNTEKDDIRLKNSSLENELNSFKLKCRQTEQSLHDLKVTISNLEFKEKDLNYKMINKNEEVERLKTELQFKSDQLKIKNGKENEHESAINHLNEVLKQKESEYMDTLSEMKTIYEKESITIKTKLKQLEDKEAKQNLTIQELESKLTKRKEKFNHFKKNSDSNIDQYLFDVNKLKSDILIYEEKLDSLKKDKNKLESEKISSVNNLKNDHQIEKHQMISKIENLTKSTELSQNQLNSVREENQTLHKNLKDLKEENKRAKIIFDESLKELKHKNSELETEIKNYKNSNKEKEQIKKLEDFISVQTKVEEELNCKIEKQIEEKKKLEDEIILIKRLMEDLEKEIKSKDEKVNHFERKLSNRNLEISSKDIKELTDKIKQLTDEKYRISQKEIATSNKLEISLLEIENKNKIIAELNKQIENFMFKERQRKSLLEKLDDSSKNKINELEAKLYEKTSELEKVKNAMMNLKNLQNENDKIKSLTRKVSKDNLNMISNRESNSSLLTDELQMKQAEIETIKEELIKKDNELIKMREDFILIQLELKEALKNSNPTDLDFKLENCKFQIEHLKEVVVEKDDEIKTLRKENQNFKLEIDEEISKEIENSVDSTLPLESKVEKYKEIIKNKSSDYAKQLALLKTENKNFQNKMNNLLNFEGRIDNYYLFRTKLLKIFDNSKAKNKEIEELIQNIKTHMMVDASERKSTSSNSNSNANSASKVIAKNKK